MAKRGRWALLLRALTAALLTTLLTVSAFSVHTDHHPTFWQAASPPPGISSSNLLHNIKALRAVSDDAPPDEEKLLIDEEEEGGGSSDDETQIIPNGRADGGALWAIERVDRITDWLPETTTPVITNPLYLQPNVPHEWFVSEGEAVAARVEVDACDDDDTTDNAVVRSRQSWSVDNTRAAAFCLAGPRQRLAFDPATTKAAIVTCGGLCPGLNTVVRELTMCLKRQYGIPTVYGIPQGYRGFLSPDSWKVLDEAAVETIHNVGGTILGSSRGGHDTDAIVDALQAHEIGLLFVIGGDGTVRGAMKIAQAVQQRELPTAVAVIPKTIDNDIPIVDRTFGFETAVEAARHAINAAHVEADGFPMGLGIVKLMGRRSGFISMHASLGSRVVDLCLVPEVPFDLDDENGGILEHLYQRLVQNGKAVVVVAEGAGEDLLLEASNAEQAVDASGNVLLQDVGPWLCKELKTRLDQRLAKAEEGLDATSVSLKYVDPSYMLRGVPSNAADNVYCTLLAHHAVHGAMAGLTSFLVGPVNTRVCYVPLQLVADKRNVIDAGHRSLWANVVFDTGQPAATVDPDVCDISDIDITTASGGCIVASP